MKSNLVGVLNNAIGGVFILTIVAAGQILGQIDDLPPKIGMPYTTGNPTKVPLENGGYKLVYKNREGHTFRISEYAPVGSMLQVNRLVKESRVSAIRGDGNSYDVTIESYKDHPDKLGAVQREGAVVLKYENGVNTEKRVHKAKDGFIVSDLRTITRYLPGHGPEGATQVEKRVLGKWVKVSPFAGTTWRLEVDGKQQAGEYTFVESPAITEIRHDSKVWLLMFGPIVEKRSVVVPAESKDHLGFARRHIQLRGNADVGRLEFWLTPDLTTMNFEKTNFALVREDN